MAQQQNFTTLVIQDGSGGTPQMIKLGTNKIPFQIATSSTGGPTIKRIIRATGDMNPVYQDGKITNRQLIAVPAKQTINIPGIRGPLVVPVNSVPIKRGPASIIEQNISGGSPSISSVIESQPATLSVPSISTSVPGHLQSSNKISFNASVLQAQVKHIANPLTIKQPTVQIQKPSEMRVQTIGRDVKPIQLRPLYQEAPSNNHVVQNDPASPSKIIMNSSILDHNGTRKRHEIDFDYNGPNKRRKTEKGGKGLRHFSMKVCEKVKAKGTTSYNEVADELVTEFTEANRTSVTETVNYDQKNIRRRVYDALNVLMAMNIISKEKKEIKWLGLPRNSAQECYKLQLEREKAEQRIKLKTQQLQDLILQQISFKNLVERNRSREQANGSPYMPATIQLPFVIVNTNKDTVIDCSISDDKKDYTLAFDDTFEIHDDIEILKKMGMALGLEKGGCSEEVIEQAKRMVPKALEDYVGELGANGSMSGKRTDMMGIYAVDCEMSEFEQEESRDEKASLRGGRLSRHSSIGSLNHDLRTESGTPSSFGDFEDHDSDIDAP